MAEDGIHGIVVFSVFIALAPFEHLVVCHDLFKGTVSNLASESIECFLSIGCPQLCSFDRFNLPSVLRTIIVRVCDEGSPQQGLDVDYGHSTRVFTFGP